MSSVQKSKKSQQKLKSKPGQDNEQLKKFITSDDRFKAVHFDPRFASVAKKDRKFKIDDRFGKVLSDPRFKMVGNVDKYGRKLQVPKSNKEMEDFYYVDEDGVDRENGEEVEELDDEEDVTAAKAMKLKNKQDKEKNGKANKEVETNKNEKAKGKANGKKSNENNVNCFTEDGRFEWNVESSEESDMDDIALDGEIDMGDMELWESENEDIPEGDPHKRLALVNYDWENTKAGDIMMFLSSFAPRNGYIRSVKVYPSEFGLERMKEEEKLGPQGIWRNKTNKAEEDEEEQVEKKGKNGKIEKKKDEYDVEGPWIFREGDDENDIDPIKLRKYEKDRLRYYYAIIDCDSIGTAKHIYENCDGLEFELTSIKIDLRYVPDNEKFIREPKEVCTEVPTTASVNCFLNRAKQHTNVKLTWDEPKPDRFKELHKKNMSLDDYDKLDLTQYIGDSDSSADSEDREEELAKKRDLLLGGLSSDWKSDFDKSKKKKMREGDMVIKFNPGFDTLGNKILEKVNPEKAKKNQKRVTKVKEDDDYFAEEEPEDPEILKKRHAELGLYVDEEGQAKSNFKADYKDPRFRGFYEQSERYQVDPTSKNYDSKNNQKWLEQQIQGRKKLKK